jgi:hypothetical protein
VFDDLKNTINDFVKRADEVGNSKALATFLGADSRDRSDLRKPIDYLVHQHTFRFSVRNFLLQVGGEIDEMTLDMISRKVKLEDCPGAWLKYAVQIQMRKATPVDHPSNYYDLEHLSYLPYVNTLFADKRVATFARQILGSDELPTALHTVRPPISIPNSIDSLESSIRSLT